MSNHKDLLNKLRPATRKKVAGKIKAMRKAAMKSGEAQLIKVKGKLKG